MKKLVSLFAVLAMLLTLGVPAFAAESKIATDPLWKISASSDRGDTVGKAFDGNADTYWHTHYTAEGQTITGHDECPHVITVEFGKTLQVSGWAYTPRHDNATGTIQAYDIYASTDGTTYKKIYTGVFSYEGIAVADRSEMRASWGNVSMNAIKIVATATTGGYGTAAEIAFLTGGSGQAIQNGEVYKEEAKKTVTAAPAASTPSSASTDAASGAVLLEKDSAWTITASSVYGAYSPEKAIDGDVKSYWHTNYTAENGAIISHDECPHILTVDFGKEVSIGGWIYTPRSDNAAGTFKEYNVYASTDGNTFVKFYSGTFDKMSSAVENNVPTAATWDPVKVRAIRLEATVTQGGYGTAAEIDFIKGDASASAPKEVVEEVDDGTVKKLSRAGWKATANSVKIDPAKALDGDEESYWHSMYTAEGSTITSHDNPPYTFEIILPEATMISGVAVLPRQDQATGRFQLFDVRVSDSDTGEYVTVKENVEAVTKSTAEIDVIFDVNVKVKRIMLYVKESGSGYGTLAEVDAYSENKALPTAQSLSEYAELAKINKVTEIDNSLFTVNCEIPIWDAHTPDLVLDGAVESFWQTDAYKGTVTLEMDMKDVYDVKQIVYTPRQTDDHHGVWRKVNIWASADGSDWTLAKENYELEDTIKVKTILFDETVKARYLQFEILEYMNGRAAAGEIQIFQLGDDKKSQEHYELTIGSPVLKTTTGEKTLDVSPYIANDSTLIPLRGLLEEMGAEVGWDGDTRTVTIKKGAQTITLQINYNLAIVEGTRYGTIRYTLLTRPVIKDSRTFIPVRFVSEILGYNVGWDGATQTVTIGN